MGAPIRQCSVRLHQEVGHQRRSGVSRLAAPGELPFLGSSAFPLYPSVRGGGRQRVVGVAAARAGRYAGRGERD